MKGSSGCIVKCFNHESFLDFVRFVSEGKAEHKLTYEEAKIWATKLVLPISIAFELSDRIRKGRLTKFSQDQILKSVLDLKEYFNNEIECFSKEFMDHTFALHYEDFEEKLENLSNTIPDITNDIHEGDFLGK